MDETEEDLRDTAIWFVRQFSPSSTEAEALELHREYRSYVDEGYSSFRARTIVGLLTPSERGEY